MKKAFVVVSVFLLSVVGAWGQQPAIMALYPARGQPDVETNMACLPVASVVAGVPLPLQAKLFSADNQWLNAYEADNAPITWAIQELTGATNTGTLNKYTGDLVLFTGYKAYQIVKVTATFSQGTITISQSINLSVTPGPAPRQINPGIYLISLKTSDRQLVKGRFMVVW
ncbi:MAG TPA: hypothetical protein VLX68_11385 [Chitinivibrionales bacterium]|nr:hypothetical protein [Chitinivibrionales bacterium]